MDLRVLKGQLLPFWREWSTQLPRTPGPGPPYPPAHLWPWVEVAGRQLLGSSCQVTTVSRAEGSHQRVGQVRETGGPAAGVLAGCEGWGLLPVPHPGHQGRCWSSGDSAQEQKETRGDRAGEGCHPFAESPCLRAQGMRGTNPRAGPRRVRPLEVSAPHYQLLCPGLSLGAHA